MSISSHTGLIASQPKVGHRITQVGAILPEDDFSSVFLPVTMRCNLSFAQQQPSRAITDICAVTQRAPLLLRPFAAIYNPYSKSCSVLCNHPATPEVKNVVKLAKQSWASVASAGRRRSTSVKMSEYDLPDNVPEELFRRFTDTDSRPMTPTPTVISNKTRVSVSSLKNSRRCVTPEPKTICSSEKKRLILDLRRSHSQETIYWNAPSDMSPAPGASSITDWTPQPEKLQKEAETKAGKPPVPSMVVTSTGSPEPKECRVESPPQNCAFSRDEMEDEPRRRGKRRKKNRNQTDTATFRPNQDPVTQVATLVPDSPSQSQRASLATNESVLMPAKKSSQDTPLAGRRESARESSFLDDDLLSLLRRGICVDVIENSFGSLMNAALREAIRSLPFDVDPREPEVVRNVRETLNLPAVNHEKWLTLPRKYTRLVSRFELPIDSTDLSQLTPVEYLSKYVSVSNYRKQLYHRIFIRYIPEIKIDELGEREADWEAGQDDWAACEDMASEYLSQRLIPAAHMQEALKTALHPHGSPTTLATVADKLALTPHDGINFRAWCGIVAFAERFITTIHRERDARHEIEVTDFESLDRRLNGIDVHPRLKEILYIIRS
ncbi:uncharacterized protein LOC132256051 [Phlebotomus argentipes]|uniref:uncharacterized protein LOC132256051 n=1 Tax=Phlebotomus argentipes TaxID=94469 RepID=UPI002892D5F8|nr:uncharacterized protein LOC132256051 [Phlebotomus argentipes]